MLKEEILKRGLDLDTINKISLVGDRVLVLLDQASDHTKTESGLIIPLSRNVETDGGRMKSEISKRKHLDAGIVVAVSEYAKSKLEEIKSELKEGDRVYVTANVGKNVASFEFMELRDKLVQDFNGLVCIPHTLIEAKINDGKSN